MIIWKKNWEKIWKKMNNKNKWCSFDNLAIFFAILALLFNFNLTPFECICLNNALCVIAGGVCLIYIIYAWCLWRQKPKFDWHLTNGDFLKKVFALVLLMPSFISFLFIIFNSDYSPKNLVYDENLYTCDSIETDSLGVAKNELFTESAFLSAHNLELRCDSIIMQKNELPGSIISAQKDPSIFWTVYYHFIDPGNQHMSTSQSGRGWTALIAILGVFLLNGVLVSSIIGYIDRRKEKWLNGSIRYNNLGKNNYAVVIGANEIAASVIKNLLTPKPPKEEGKLDFYSEGDNEYIVLQTSREVQEVRGELESKLDKEELKKVIIYKALRDSKEELKKLYIENATEVYILGETSLIDGGESFHDAINMKCLNTVADILDEAKDNDKQPQEWHRKVCKVLFEYQTTYSIFLFSDVQEKINKHLVFIPFNRYDSWARRVMVGGSYCKFENDKIKSQSTNNDFIPLDGNDGINKDSDEHVHFIVVGMSKMGVSMGIQALLQAHYINYTSAEKEGDVDKMNKRRTRLTFIDSNADKERNFFMGRYQNLFNLVRNRYIDTTCGMDNTTEWSDPMNNNDSEWNHLNTTKDGRIKNGNFLDVEIEFIKGELESQGVRKYLSDISNNENEWVKNSKLTIAICLTQTHQSIAASLYMPISVYDKVQQVWVYQPDAEDIISNLKDSDQKDKRYKMLRAFGMVDRDYMSNRSLYLKSILVNAMYDIKKDEKDENNNLKGFYVNEIDMGDKDKYKQIRAMWKKLTIDKKFSNKYFVDSITQKIRSIIVEPFTLKELENAINNEENKEILARCEHNRWNIQQLLLGYSPCPKDVDMEIQELEKNKSTENAKQKRNDIRERFAQKKYNCTWNELNPLQKQELIESEFSDEYYKTPHGIFDKVKEDYKTGENRMHANICSYDHLDVVDSGAKDYDEALNSKIPMFIEKVDLYTPSEKKNKSKK